VKCAQNALQGLPTRSRFSVFGREADEAEWVAAVSDPNVYYTRVFILSQTSPKLPSLSDYL
jgi:hypothetical protein